MTRRNEYMVFERGSNSQDYLRCLFVLAILFLIDGCAHDHGITIQDQKVIKEGLYEVQALDNTWLQIPNFGGHTIYVSSDRDDIVYLRCPDQQLVAIIRADNRRHPKRFRNVSPTFEEAARYFVEDYNEDAGTIVQESIVSHAMQLNDTDAIEFEYLVSNPLRLCSRVDKDLAQIKVKMIITKYWRPGGDGGMIALIYKSPPETFDQKIGEFNQMVQSFRFTK